MKIKTHKICYNPECENEFKLYKTTDKYCSASCQKKCEPPKEKKPIVFNNKPRKPINKKSKKQIVLDAKYMVLRKVFLAKPENQICPITQRQTIEVHHTYCGKDRSKYYLDVSTWLAVSRDGHNWIHDNPKESRELGFLK